MPSVELEPHVIQRVCERICDRHRGAGADGILLPMPTQAGQHAVRIFNPDGSEAEKSGNGMRIFARWLFDIGRVGFAPFEVRTAGGLVRCTMLAGPASQVQVDMGQVAFEDLNLPLHVGDHTIQANIVSIGNPHCVILCDEISPAQAQALGPVIEIHPRFPNRTNVQFAHVLSRHHLQLEIWERGAGYTLASGSSSCAAAAVAVRLGLCDPELTVHMPGGDLEIVVSPDFHVQMTGPVVRVADLEMHAEAFA